MLASRATGVEVLLAFIHHQIQPPQARAHPMYEYTGSDDETRGSPEPLEEDVILKCAHDILKECTVINILNHPPPILPSIHRKR